MRAAIYARMSTDKQSADSPADQVARCREYAEREGWQVVEGLVIQEAGVSGSSRHNRDGLLDLIARIDEWDTLLCWYFSRLARDSEDQGWIRNKLRVSKRNAVDVSVAHAEGAADASDRGLRAECPEGDDLGDAVVAVAFGRVADHLVAAVLGEVHVNVRHLLALYVKEALED